MIKECLYRPYWGNKNRDGFSFYACGWAQYHEILLDAQGILDVIIQSDIKNTFHVYQLVSALNGNFSIIISSLQETIIAADRMRTYPVVYFFNDENLVITDNINEYRKNNNEYFLIDEIVLEQYLCSDYVFGPYTIFKNVFSVQSGEIVTINHATKSFKRKQYFQWIPNMNDDSFKRNLEAEAKQQDIIFTNVFTRMIKSAPDIHNWVIPLSGGYDSRTIVNYLYKLGIKNVICFSYGMKNNIQSKISKQVSEALGYKWYFIDYSEWIEKIQINNLIAGYIEFAFNGTSVAHLQDFPAVYALKEMGVLQQNDIFIPGHALEVLAGSHLKLQMQKCSSIELVIPVLKKHISGFGYYTEKRKNVIKHVLSIIEKYNMDPAQIAECFDWQERQTKFIAHGVKCYEYFGFGWRIPEWDLELFNYWSKIGFNYRYNRNMYKDLFKKYMMVDAIKPISFSNDLTAKAKKSLKTTILNSLPVMIKRMLKKSGFKTSYYYVGEGSHLIYSDITENISEYSSSFSVPVSLKKYLKVYPQNQNLSGFPLNSVSTLKNIRRSCIN